MAFVHGVSNALTLGGGWHNHGLSPRFDHGPYPVINARNTSTSNNNTVNLFLDGIDPDLRFAASIVTACVDQTVYAIQCTSGPANVGPETCGPNVPHMTLTVGEGIFDYITTAATRTLGYDLTVSAHETCVLAGTTAATCTATASFSGAGFSTSTTLTETATGTDYYRYDVEITAGAEKTAHPTATCASTGAAASLNSKTMAIWALAGVIGVASILTIS